MKEVTPKTPLIDDPVMWLEVETPSGHHPRNLDIHRIDLSDLRPVGLVRWRFPLADPYEARPGTCRSTGSGRRRLRASGWPRESCEPALGGRHRVNGKCMFE